MNAVPLGAFVVVADKEHAWLKMKVSESKVVLSKDLGGKLKGFASKGKFKKVYGPCTGRVTIAQIGSKK